MRLTTLAPALDASGLSRCEALAEGAPAEVRAPMTVMAGMVRDHLAGHARRYGYTHDECDRYGRTFDGIPAGELRNAAFHLLWYAREFAAGREPNTITRHRETETL